MTAGRVTLPQCSDKITLSIPLPHVLLLTLSNPKERNAIGTETKQSMEKVLNWFEEEPELWAVVITGTGKAFCAGQNLKGWTGNRGVAEIGGTIERMVAGGHGFASVSRRYSKKPFIAAVNGFCLGGGVELVLACDLVVASETATFGLPEVQVGVAVADGGIPRLLRVAGHQRAAELLFLGKKISAHEAKETYRFVNEIVPPDAVLPRALEIARLITTTASPDAIQNTKRGLTDALLKGGTEEAWYSHVTSPESRQMFAGDNIREGTAAFSEKRKPKWTSPKTKL